MKHTQKLFFLLITLCYAHATLSSDPTSAQDTPAEQSSSAGRMYQIALSGPGYNIKCGKTVDQEEYDYIQKHPDLKPGFIGFLSDGLLEATALHRLEPKAVASVCLKGALTFAVFEDVLEESAKKRSEEAEKLDATKKKPTEKKGANSQPSAAPTYQLLLSGPGFKLGNNEPFTPDEDYLKQITRSPIFEHISALGEELQGALLRSCIHEIIFL